jgi:hypothetical protein
VGAAFQARLSVITTTASTVYAARRPGQVGDRSRRQAGDWKEADGDHGEPDLASAAGVGPAVVATIPFGHRRLGPDVWEPAAGSEAAAELASTESRANGSPWGEQVPRTTYHASGGPRSGIAPQGWA